jgi:hypothetical protein
VRDDGEFAVTQGQTDVIGRGQTGGLQRPLKVRLK